MFDTGFDPTASLPADPDEMRLPAGLFLLATLRDEPIGYGALKFHGRQPTELKRVAPNSRGLGVGRRLLAELERHAVHHGTRTVRLETNRSLVEAVAIRRLSRSRGVQRRALRPPLVREAHRRPAPTITAGEAGHQRRLIVTAQVERG